jgi:hypothetical protein
MLKTDLRCGTKLRRICTPALGSGEANFATGTCDVTGALQHTPAVFHADDAMKKENFSFKSLNSALRSMKEPCYGEFN